MSIFLAGNVAFSVTLKTLVLLFLFCSTFYDFQYLFYKNTFVLTFIMGILYYLPWRELKSIKIKNDFFLPTCNKSARKNDPRMQLPSIFHKTVNRNKLKVWKFHNHRISSFSAIKKTVIEVMWGVSILKVIEIL